MEEDDEESWLREAARAPVVERLPRTGERYGRYTIGEEVGRGGMGIVYLARDEDLGRDVALKLLHGDRVADAERRSRFAREARLAARLTHPAIALVYDAGEIDGVPFLAMEHVRGRTLRQRMREGPLGETEALAIASSVASGLAYAHAAKVVHRDLKPENVMLTDGGAVKILDFGAAKTDRVPLVDGATLATVEGHLIGTPAYMAPEQARGEAVDARTDVFSFGVVLYEMIAGRRPFGGATALDVLVAIQRDEPPPLTASSPLALLVARCLAKRPGDRFASGDDLVNALAGLPAQHRRRRAIGLVTLVVGAAGLLAAGRSLVTHAPAGVNAPPFIAPAGVSTAPVRPLPSASAAASDPAPSPPASASGQRPPARTALSSPSSSPPSAPRSSSPSSSLWPRASAQPTTSPGPLDEPK